MDPTETLRQALDAMAECKPERSATDNLRSQTRAAEHLEDLIRWFRSEGFAPSVEKVLAEEIAEQETAKTLPFFAAYVIG